MRRGAAIINVSMMMVSRVIDVFDMIVDFSLIFILLCHVATEK